VFACSAFQAEALVCLCLPLQLPPPTWLDFCSCYSWHALLALHGASALPLLPHLHNNGTNMVSGTYSSHQPLGNRTYTTATGWRTCCSSCMRSLTRCW
jgi:hypothetical protein